MEKTDAIRKVQGLEALAADEAASQPERDSAAALAKTLRSKYEIEDRDIDIAEPFIFFGHDVFFWQREIVPLLEKAEAAINEALAKADAAPMPRDRVETYVKVHQAMKHATEETGWAHTMRLKLKSRRNAVLREAVDAEFKETYDSRVEMHKEFHGGIVTEDDDVYLREQAMEWAIWRVALECDLRKDVVARVAKAPGRRAEGKQDAGV